MSKKNVAEIMPEQQFWQIVAKSEKGQKLKEVLYQLSEEEMLGFYYWNLRFDRLSYTDDLWCVAYIVMGGCSDDCFMDFRYWLVLQGENIYKKAIKNVDSLYDTFESIEEGDIPLMESFYEFGIVYQERFTNDFDEYYEENYSGLEYNLPVLNSLWSDKEENSMKNICPHTFEKWWGNDRF